MLFVAIYEIFVLYGKNAFSMSCLGWGFFSWWTQQIHIKPIEHPIEPTAIIENCPSKIRQKLGIPARKFEKSNIPCQVFSRKGPSFARQMPKGYQKQRMIYGDQGETCFFSENTDTWVFVKNSGIILLIPLIFSAEFHPRSSANAVCLWPWTPMMCPMRFGRGKPVFIRSPDTRIITDLFDRLRSGCIWWDDGYGWFLSIYHIISCWYSDSICQNRFRSILILLLDSEWF